MNSPEVTGPIRNFPLLILEVVKTPISSFYLGAATFGCPTATFPVRMNKNQRSKVKLESKGVIIEILRSCIPCRVHNNEGLMFESCDSFEVRDAFLSRLT